MRLARAEQHSDAAQWFLAAAADYGNSDQLVPQARSLQGAGRSLGFLEDFAQSRKAYAAANAIFVEYGLRHEQARCEIGLGHAAGCLGQHFVALRAYRAARSLARTSGTPRHAAGALLSIGQTLGTLGRHVPALPACQRAAAEFEALGDHHNVASCQLSIAHTLRNLSRYDEARAALHKARSGFDALGRKTAAARCQLAEAKLEHALGRFEQALALARASRAEFERASEHRSVAGSEMAMAHALRRLVQPQKALPLFRSAEQTLRHEGNVSHAAIARMDQARVLFELGRSKQALRTYRRAWPVLEREGLSLYAAMCLRGCASALRTLGRHEEAMAAARQARARFSSLQAHAHRIDADRLLCRLLLEAGKAAQALTLALKVVAESNVERYLLADPAERRLMSESYAGTFAFALDLATRLSLRPLLVELVEAARMQAVPLETSAHAQQSRGDPRSEGALRRLAPAPAISVHGRSHLAPGRTSAPTTVDLDELRAAFDPAAWWLSTWVIRDRLWWSLLGPERQVDAGSAPVRPALLHKLSAAIARPLPGEVKAAMRWELDPMTVRRRLQRLAITRALCGPLVADRERAELARSSLEHEDRELFAMLPALDEPVAAERLLAAELGRWLLPAPLLAALEQGRRDHPVPLLLSVAPELAQVPWSLLMLPEAGGGESSRLVDRGVCLSVPNAGLLHATVGRTPHQVPPQIIVVCDPCGDMPHARAVPPHTDLLLTGAGHLQNPGGRCEAPTPEAVIDALSRLSPGQEGAFIYQGHYVAPRSARPVDSGGLQLAAGIGGRTLLSPGAFSQPAARGRPNSPRNAWLLGCQTLGADSGPEWLGMTPALLRAGARHVISTRWPIFDHPAISRFERALLETGALADRPARLLRAYQLQALDEFRSRPQLECAPYIWAAYEVTGVLAEKDG